MSKQCKAFQAQKYAEGKELLRQRVIEGPSKELG